MNLLNEYREDIHFRSSNSLPIKLPIQPTSSIQQLMSKLVPTVRGATLIDTSMKFQSMLTDTFSIPILNSHIVEHRLLSKFLSFYGIYKTLPASLSESDKTNLKALWFQDF